MHVWKCPDETSMYNLIYASKNLNKQMKISRKSKEIVGANNLQLPRTDRDKQGQHG
jgi:hypothetical protein